MCKQLQQKPMPKRGKSCQKVAKSQPKRGKNWQKIGVLEVGFY